MRPRLVLTLPALVLLCACSTAYADPPPWAHGTGKPKPTRSTPAPTPTVPPTTTPAPTTVPATTPAPTSTAPTPPPGLTLVFADDFDGTALDTSRWTGDWFGGGTMNNTPTRAANVTVAGGLLRLQLALEGSTVTGALVHTDYGTGRYQLRPGGYVEARVWFPGAGPAEDVFNWPAWWASGPSWPSAGEHDIAEGLGGDLTINYHSPSINQQYPVNPVCCWGNAWHTFGLYRGTTSADVYWDGVRQAHYATADNGNGEELILNAGKSNSRTPVLGAAGAVLVDWVRAYA